MRLDCLVLEVTPFDKSVSTIWSTIAAYVEKVKFYFPFRTHQHRFCTYGNR